MLFHVKILVQSFHRLQALELQNVPELVKDEQNAFLYLADVAALLELFFRPVAIIEHIQQGNYNFFSGGFFKLVALFGASFLKIVKFGKQAKVFILLGLQFLLQFLHLIAVFDPAESGGAGHVFIRVDVNAHVLTVLLSPGFGPFGRKSCVFFFHNLTNCRKGKVVNYFAKSVFETNCPANGRFTAGGAPFPYFCNMTKVYLNRKIAPRIQKGHPWIYSNELNRTEPDAEAGQIVEVFSHDRKFIGKGYINPKSQITVRLLTRERNVAIDEDFFDRRIWEAWQYRKKIGYLENCRLVFGESDGLPGLIIDKFNDYFVLQTLALGIDCWKGAIVKALEKHFHPKGIYERNDVPVRELEGLPQQKGFLSPEFDTRIMIRENGLRFWVDLANGQKTGYFLDQSDNRRAIRHIVKGADVLGAFSYTGSFEVQAAGYGAKSVLGLDISAAAVAMASQNAELNGLENIVHFETTNAFDALKLWSKETKQFDVVMIDPPAFTKSRETIQNAVSGYKEINLRAIKLVKKGGFLVTSSCSNLVQPEVFLEVIGMAASDAHRKLRQVCFQSQASDHPIVWNLENTHYLKFLIAQVL
jgi:23S rRNA (cytosine1962-C5)-methyltransferase